MHWLSGFFCNRRSWQRSQDDLDDRAHSLRQARHARDHASRYEVGAKYLREQLGGCVGDLRVVAKFRCGCQRHGQTSDTLRLVQRSEMLPRQRERIERCQAGRAAPVFDAEIGADSPEELRDAALQRQRPAHEQQIPDLYRFDIGAQRLRRRRQLDPRRLQPLFGIALHVGTPHHLPRCAPLSTFSTTPVTRGASVRNSTASAMSWVVPTCPIGDNDCRKSFGKPLSNGVSTTPGATAFTRIPCFAYSIARLREIALMPPLVIIGTEADSAAIGRSAMEAVMLTTLPPRFCSSKCSMTRCVTWMKPSRLVDTSERKSSAVYCVKGLAKKMPALLTSASIEPKRFTAVSTSFAAVAGNAMSPSINATCSERCSSLR